MMKPSYFLLLFIFLTAGINAQSISGVLTRQANQDISLTGFNYYTNYKLASTTIDSLGNFTLRYPKEYKGMAILKTSDKSSLILVTEGKKITLKGSSIQDSDSVVYLNSHANTKLTAYAKAQHVYANANAAWRFLDKLYQENAIFKEEQKIKLSIKKEQARIAQEDNVFLTNLPKKSYVRWFIPYRKLVQEMPAIVRRETERIPAAIAQFRATNFTHPNFKTSGLFKELIEGHYMLLESMGQSLDSISTQMNLSTDYLLDHLKNNTSLLNKVSLHLFDYLEKRSFFEASAYLSQRLLYATELELEDQLINKLEGYRKMKVGNIAPEIQLENKKLSELKTNKLVVFGASWCPSCKSEALELLKYQAAWKAKNVAIIYIAVDTDPIAFKTAYKDAPWLTYCDYKGWETQAAKDYYISGTPSYFLLDATNKILLRPNSAAHANSWVNYKM